MFQQAPAFEVGDSRGLDRVSGDDVARERGLIDEQDTTTLACQQHRKRRTGASGTDYDYVIHEECCSRDFAMREGFISANVYTRDSEKSRAENWDFEKLLRPWSADAVKPCTIRFATKEYGLAQEMRRGGV
jgi:hypothetical protein